MSTAKVYFQKCSVCPDHANMLTLEVLGSACRFCQQVKVVGTELEGGGSRTGKGGGEQTGGGMAVPDGRLSCAWWARFLGGLGFGGLGPPPAQ